MAEYIDREAFLEHMKRTDRYFNVKFDIENFPTADVAPVVLCKDCSMYEAGFCFSRYVGCGSVTPQRSPDDFCSYGERRTDNV